MLFSHIKFYEKLFLFYKLCRLDKPVGFILVFFPAAYGIILASHSIPYNLLILFFISSILIRSAGCIINDYIDKDLDNQVFRTKERPLASGKVSKKEAILLLLFLLIISLVILLSLTTTAIYIGIVGFLLTCCYPFMKRITYFPQFFLGITFNIGSLLGYASIKNTIDLPSILLFISISFWIIGYDTIYGFMDIIDDKKIKIKSLSIFIENKNYQSYLFFCYSIFIMIFALIGSFFVPSYKFYRILYLIFSYFLLTFQIYKLDIKSPKNCLFHFKLNIAVGIVLFIYLIDI